MNEGQFVGELTAAQASQEKIMRAIVKNVRTEKNGDQSDE
jgi:putative multiple sugar transport system ATP-binding protein